MIILIIEFIKRHYKGFLSGLGILWLCLYVRACTKAQEEAKHSPLPPNVIERVTVKHGVVTLQTPSGLKHIAGVREGSLTIYKDGTSKLDVKTSGFEHSLGMNGFVNRDGGALGLDFRGYYWKKADLMVGLGFSPKTSKLDCWFGVGYQLPEPFSNTSFYIGYSVHQTPVVGLSVRL